MRRIVAAAIGCALVVAMAPVTPSAVAAATPVVVNGFDLPARVKESTHRCTGDVDQTVTHLYRQGSPLGSHATGYQVGGANFMAGRLAAVNSPTSLTSLSFAIDHLPPSAADVVAGYYVVQFFTSANVQYNGFRALTSTGTGWSTGDVAALDLDWYLVSGDNQTATGDFVTLPEFATSHGGDGLGAWAGVEFGCDGRSYYLDDLTVVSDLGEESYDFEGALSRSYISAPASHHATTLTRNLRTLTLTYPQTHYLAADGTVVGDGVLETAYIDGTAQLYSRSYGQSAFHAVGSPRAYTAEGYAFFGLAPRRRTTYLIRSLPQDCCEASSSLTLTIFVKRRVKATLARQKVHRGDRIVVTGVVGIRDSGVPMALQRHTATGWHTLTTTRTTSTGTYRLAARATSVGKWRLRVRAGAAKGLLGNVSTSFVETILRNPPPPSPPTTVDNPPPTTPHIPDPDDDLTKRIVVPAASAVRSGGPAGVVPPSNRPPVVLGGAGD